MRRVLIFACALVLLFSFFALPTGALTLDDILPDLLEAMPDGGGDLSDYADPEKAGELLGIEYLSSLVLAALSGGLSSSLGFFGQMLGAVILVAVLSLFAKHLDGAAARAASFGIAAVLAVSVFALARSDMEQLTGTLEGMCRLSDALGPIFATLFASGGSAGAAAAAASGFATLSFLLTHAIAALLSPMLCFLFGLCALSVFGEGGQTGGLFRTVRGLYLTVLLFLSVLLVTSLGFQSTLAASADSLAVGSVRFAVGNLIPIVGGTLGGSLRTLAASLSLIRSTVGTLTLVSLLASVLPVLVSLLLHRFCLSLCSDLAGMLGADDAKRIFEGFRGIYDLAVATLSLAFVLFFFVLGILCHTVTAIG